MNPSIDWPFVLTILLYSLSILAALANGLTGLLRMPLVRRKTGARRIPGLSIYPIAALGVVACSLGVLLSTLPPLAASGAAGPLVVISLAALGIDLLAFAWIVFVLQFTRGLTSLPRGLLFWLALFPLLSQATVAIALWQGLEMSAGLLAAGSPNTLNIQYGAWRFAHLLYALGLFAGGLALLAGFVKQAPRLHHRLAMTLAATALGVFLIYLIELAGLGFPAGEARLLLTPLAFTIAMSLYAWAILRRRLPELNSLAKEALFDEIWDGVLIVDAAGEIADLNTAAEHILGLPAAGVIGQPALRILPYAGALLNGDRRVNSGKIEISLGEGPEQRAFNLIVNPLLGSQGEHAGRLVILQDAQSRQIAEQALNESDQRFQALFSQAQEGLLLLNAFGSITACNAAAERLLGFKADQIIGKTLLDPRWRTIHADGSAFPGEDHPAILALRSGKSQAGVEMGIRKPDGDLSWVNVSAEPLLAGKSFRSGDISEATPNDSPRGFGALTFLLDLGVRPPAQESPSQSETQALALVENAPLAILIAGADGLIRAANQHAEQLFGYAKNELLDQPFEFLLPEHFWKTHPQLRSQILKSPETAAPESEAVLELVGMRKDGSEFPLELRLGNVAAPGEVQIVLYAIDTTHQRNFESELDASNRLLEVSLKNLEVRNRELKLLSEMGNMLQRCASQDEAHLVIAELARQLFPDLSGVLYKHDWMRGMLEAVITWGSTLPNELIFSPDACWGVRLGRSHMPRRNGGRLRCQHIAGDEPGANASLCVPLIHMNETIGLLHLRGKNSELDDSREHLAIAAAEQITLALSNLALRENLRVQSIRDPLTGLYNQRYMEESLSRELSRAERYHLPLGVIIIDIDHFKQFNDSFGHIAADDLLRSFAAFLQNTVRGEDIVCRYDAEEFAVILPDTGLDGCQYLAEKLRQGASQLQSEYLRQVFEPVTISMGIACYPEHGPSAGELLQAAGHALYLAINQGRDQFALAR